ncbi:N-acetylneuraminate synthase family protein [Candidatus Woesearchaeota archaeon]|nr:N-acetylneuraminate synthase family protein [Candidatus Woesearchaeota archaeon]
MDVTMATYQWPNEPFIIAEIGGNHEGNFSYAKKLLSDVVKSGADAVKFQIYTADKIVNKIEGAERNKHFKKFSLSTEQFIELAHSAKKNNILFMASLWDEESIETFNPYLSIHKVGSGDMTNYPLLELLAKKDKPLIISTAMATLAEIKDMVRFLDSINPRLRKEKKLALLHCVATYGDPKDEYAQLLAIKKMQEEFKDIAIGYSDHTGGIYACELAIAMGCKIIEKHFTDDKKREFRDHHISADLEDMRTLLEKKKKIYALLGTCEKQPVAAIETSERIKEFRRAVYLKKDAPAGTLLTKEMLTTLRPNRGIDARDFYKLLGKKLVVKKKAFESISWKDVQ